MLEQQRSLQQVFFVPGKQKKVKEFADRVLAKRHSDSALPIPGSYNIQLENVHRLWTCSKIFQLVLPISTSLGHHWVPGL